MLIEIESPDFKINGNPRGPIRFNSGLNVVKGVTTKPNSIGKTLFLLAIDACFGGKTYFSRSDLKDHYPKHKLFFTFRFNGIDYYFCRTIEDPDIVLELEADKSIKRSLKRDDFCFELAKLYGQNEKSFRRIISRFSRIFSKGNYNQSDPMNPGHPEKQTKAFSDLEILFDKFDTVQEAKRYNDEKQDAQKAFTAAKNNDVLFVKIPTAAEYKENITKLKDLEDKRKALVNSLDREISDDDLENANEIFEIKREITKLNRKITAYKTRLNRLSNNVSETVISDAMDLDELKAFFPNMNFRRIEEIQDFHRKISRLVNPRIEEEISIIENMIFRAEESVKELENRCRQKGTTVNFSAKFLNDFSEVERQIAITKTQNSNYNKVKSIRDEAKIASKNLKELEIGILRDIAEEINKRISYLNGLIDSATEKAPVLTIKGNTSYSFSSDDDKGMGTSYKNLILFDLSIFQLTWLPVLIHDSMIFNNLSEKRLNGIFQLLGKSEKQLFVAFDHFDGLAPETLGIIDNAAIIELDLDGKQLFGSAWNTIQSL